MAYIDDIPISSVDVQLASESETALKAFAIRVIWQLYEKHKHESYKGVLWGVIPYSIKVAKIEPILIKWLGPNPYA